jgi:bifunctional DNA-binding transcriptional regulator/antitoxin component of YhaV-PrlF toxin-antitoxin module
MKFLIWFGVAFGLFYYFFLVGPHYQNFKLTATIRTPDGVQTSSVVRRLTFEYQWTFPKEIVNKVGLDQFGEALVISYEDGPTVFVPLDYRAELTLLRATRSLPVEGIKPSSRNKKALRAWLRKLSYEQPAQPVLEAYYPTLLVFDDVDDYRTVRVLEREELREILKDGFSVPVFSIEPTKEVITDENIKNILPWIEQLERNYQPVDRALRDALKLQKPLPQIFRRMEENR